MPLFSLPSFVFLSICAHEGTAVDLRENYTFAHFKSDFHRSYDIASEEHGLREAIFNKRLAEALEHNARRSSWKKTVNHLSDLTEDELDMLLGYKPPPRRAQRMSSSLLQGAGVIDDYGDHDGKYCSAHNTSCLGAEANCCSGLICGNSGSCEKATKAASFDWAHQLSTAHSILEQGKCGSCWALAAAAAINLAAEKVTEGRFTRTLSPQNLLACTPNKMECGGQGGCKGATSELAFDWLQSQGAKGGVYTIEDQQYTAKDDACSPAKASFLQRQHAVSIKGWKKLQENNAEDMMQTLVTVGPLVASIAAKGMHGYSSGVINDCDDRVVNHAVVMMGYGFDKENEIHYWNLRNSWGKDWGENGFFRVQRFAPHSEEPCGWDMEPAKGVVCKDKAGPEGKYPEKQWVCGACGVLIDTAYPIGTQVPESLLDASSASLVRLGAKSKKRHHKALRAMDTAVKDNVWCKTQCQHFASPTLSKALGQEFSEDPTECSRDCDQFLPSTST